MYKILIVDDEELIRKGIARMIEISNPEFNLVGEASNGKEGLELILRHKPHVAIVDIRMPFMNGLEMIDRVKQSFNEIRFIILSAYTDYQYTRHAIKSGVVDYLRKPVNRLELSEILKSIKESLDEKTISDTKDDIPKAEVNSKEPRNDRKIIDNAKKYINSNFFNDISLESAANHVNMNTNYFSSLFKKETGENFIDYLTRIRIEKAKVLLDNPRLKIYEIAQVVGYYSPKHFARLFKDITGVTPTEYRDRANKSLFEKGENAGQG